MQGTARPCRRFRTGDACQDWWVGLAAHSRAGCHMQSYTDYVRTQAAGPRQPFPVSSKVERLCWAVAPPTRTRRRIIPRSCRRINGTVSEGEISQPRVSRTRITHAHRGAPHIVCVRRTALSACPLALVFCSTCYCMYGPRSTRADKQKIVDPARRLSSFLPQAKLPSR